MHNCDIKFFKDNVISKVFYKLTEIHFQKNDELPQQVCLKCFEKINEIHEFAFQCKRIHSDWLKCLNNLKNPEINSKLELFKKTNEPLMKEEEITIVEHKLEFVRDDILNSGCGNGINVFKEAKDNILEKYLITKPNDQNLNCSENDLSKTNTSDIKEQSEEESNGSVNLNYTSKSDDSNIEPAKKNKKTKKELHKCNACGKVFTYFKYFQKHKSLRVCARSYKCDLCFKRFSRLSYLQVHMRTHTGERPFKCVQCVKMFQCVSYLKVHMRTHTGERPFKCKQCPNSFARSSGLKSHMFMHSGERPFKCNKCSKSYCQRFHLTRHMTKHSSE